MNSHIIKSNEEIASLKDELENLRNSNQNTSLKSNEEIAGLTQELEKLRNSNNLYFTHGDRMEQINKDLKAEMTRVTQELEKLKSLNHLYYTHGAQVEKQNKNLMEKSKNRKHFSWC